MRKCWRQGDLPGIAGVRMYVTVNIYSRNHEAQTITGYLDFLKTVEPDAIIVADPAIFTQARRQTPDIPVHISTQANTTNTGTARFWRELGASRVNAARELSLEEIREIVQDSGIDVEAFVHGAMCMAVSGRCLMSGFMAGRESNRGLCCQPCRFHYTGDGRDPGPVSTSPLPRTSAAPISSTPGIFA